jgi:Protein of unknown function (DUF3060)
MKYANRFRLVLAMIACSAPIVLGQTLATGRSGNKEEIVASGKKLTYEGGGKSFEIVGHGDDITITGECQEVNVLGHDNRITVDAVGTIEASGHNNLITYHRGLNGEKPRIQTMGPGNQVMAAQ